MEQPSDNTSATDFGEASIMNLTTTVGFAAGVVDVTSLFECNNNESCVTGTENWQNQSSLNSTLDPLGGYPYPSLYNWAHIILSSIIVTIIMLIIVIGNILVIVAVAVDRNLKGLQNWFITSLAVSDLFVGLFIMPLSLANELMGYWYFGNIMCELWLAIDVLLCTASILNLCLISLDRYWSVTRAVSYVKTRTRKRAIIMIAIVWIISMITCFPPLAGWKRPQPIKFGKYPLCVLSEEPGYVVYSTVGSFYIPLIVMMAVYFKIYLAARSRARRNLRKPPPKKTAQDNCKPISACTTTTSFSKTGKLITDSHRLSPTREFSSEDEPSASASGQQSSHSGSRGSQAHDNQGADTTAEPHYTTSKLAIVNHNANFLSTDEKRKLLSGEETCETDSTCDTFSTKMKVLNDKGKHIHFSEDTDSPSETLNSQPKILPDKYYHKDVNTGEENLRPLLQESDSQRESDKNSNSLFQESGKISDKTSDSPLGDSTGDECMKLKPMQLATHARPNELPELNNKRTLRAPTTNHNHLSPTQHIRNFGNNISRKHGKNKEASKSRTVKEDPERFKRKVARAKERRATLVLGIIMATFIGCWLPFFSIYLITSLAGLHAPYMVFAVFFWLGYVNSALNPIIYTIFNRDFSNAFHRLLFGRKNRF